MTLLRRVGITAAIAVLAASAWVWWNRPRPVDMARYAPSDALIYLECNNLLDIGEALVETKAWKDLIPLMGHARPPLPGGFLRRVISWTGIGPAHYVILARAQVAAVMLDLGAREEGQTLTVKPEAAIIIETHTSQYRTRSVVDEALKRFAQTAYPGAELRRQDIDGVEVIIWSTASGDRQIAAAVIGSLVIVGNNERVVKTCLDVHRGLRPNLSGQAELTQMRQSLGASDALAFGFVSSLNAGRLISAAAPILLGTGPADSHFDRLVASGASKVLTGAGWSSRATKGGIEDRYLFSLNQNLVARLRPFFRSTELTPGPLTLLPHDTYSLTLYKFEDPLGVWRALQTGVSGQLDTLSAIVFTSLLKSGLISYGIDDPEKFLGTVGPELITARLASDSEKSILIARIRDETALKRFLLDSSDSNQDSKDNNVKLIALDGKTFAVGFLNGNVVIGEPNDVRRCLETGAARTSTSDVEQMLNGILHNSTSAEVVSSAGVVSSASDNRRVMNFVESVARANGNSQLPETSLLIGKVEALPHSTTTTTLGDQGLERITHSPFGQLGAIVSLLFPER